MFEKYAVEYFVDLPNGDSRKVGETHETGLSWSGLMMSLNTRRNSKQIPNQFERIAWDSVTIWVFDKEGRQRLLRDYLNKF